MERTGRIVFSVVAIIGKVHASLGCDRWEHTVLGIEGIGVGVEAVGECVTGSGEKD